jgi:hypothetical protein
MSPYCIIKKPVNPLGGFALILALLLMAFVLIMLFSVTTLVHVESRAASNSLHLLQARENARFALMLAIGQLQKHAGPDQRVTARADILGEGNFDPLCRFWTGVWDSTDPTARPIWLVSGAGSSPRLGASVPITMQVGFSASSNHSKQSNNFLATRVAVQGIDHGQYAWWISDEGMKAATSVHDALHDTLDALPEGKRHLDYNLNSNKVLHARHDPNFDYHLLFDINDPSGATKALMDQVIYQDQIAILAAHQSQDDQDTIQAKFRHDYTLRNRFVLSDPSHGGLKKDLSFLKTLDFTTTTQAQLDTLYNEPNNLITKGSIQLVQFRGNPTAHPSNEIIGMQLSETTIATTEAKANHFDLLPVITELQISLGIAAEDGKAANSLMTDSSIFLVYKVYLELWNPYTVPIMIGDSNMPDSLGFSDLTVEIKNLPDFNITNNNSASSAIGSMPNLRIKWSDHQSPKILRPGMVFRTSLPLDSGSISNSHGDNNSGTIQRALGLSILGNRSDNYTGRFTFNNSPVSITLQAINASHQQREMLTVELKNYSDFSIDYDYNSYNNRATWLKRVPTSSTGAWGMNAHSLEVPGYAFAFRYRMLDEQEAPGAITDISNWLSEYDVRSRTIRVDISSWDQNEPWSSTPALPYDFSVNGTDADLSRFEPSESFKGDHFFHYETSSNYTGRRDRIARIIDPPISEVTDLGAFRSLKYKDYPANSIGNSWGGDLNDHYDRYYFSTLPNPKIVEWDGVTPLANGRFAYHIKIPQLIDPNAAKHLFIENGFNLNSTSKESWKSLLSSKSFPQNTYEFRYEQANDFNSPEWGTHTTAIERITVSQPQAMVHNLNERASDSRFNFVSRASSSDYLNAFSIDNLKWLNSLQYPTFFQSIRELTEADVEALSTAIVQQLQQYHKDNGHPPLSMAAWLNSGLLQDAINTVPSLNNRKNDTDLIPTNTPAHISQATILNALGPFSFVRSDTFRIRAYGAALNESDNEPKSEAYLEAVVQRLPDEQSNRRFGRSFRILNIQWIAPINQSPPQH